MKLDFHLITLLCLLGISACLESSSQKKTSNVNTAAVSNLQNPEQSICALSQDKISATGNKNVSNSTTLDMQPRRCATFFAFA